MAPANSALAQTNNAGTETPAIVVAEAPQASAMNAILDRIQASWPWYVTRASGLIAAIAFLILMLSGVGFITGHSFAFLEPITAWATHRALGIIFGIATLLHVMALYFDTFVPFKIKELLIPFVSAYKPVTLFGINFGSLYVALGVLALYIVAAIVFTSLFWIEKKPKTWRTLHLLSYIAAIFVFVHAFFLGTDLASGILRWIWAGLGVAILIASVARLWRRKNIIKSHDASGKEIYH
jgi:DMSO/TMAO reductase YedYZ heme-binding membrane subunit